MSDPRPAHQHNVWTDAFREFDSLYEAGPEERAARLEQLRRTSPPLADAVQRLLAEHEARASQTHDWLKTLPPSAAASAAPAEPDAAPERIGPWRLLRELGQGGTARVWLARREDVPWLREVALKVPLVGLLRQDLRERLVRERDILSRLEHPNIARLYDAGFAESQPWLALEYVQGQDIVAWCDARKAGVRERVQLFRQVLHAVQYAHSALIVHRDLKPANILVTSDGSVRLLDFGIAKLIADGHDHTQTTQLTRAVGRMLTPAYASPEQLRDEPLTTATDIYSLGLVLYLMVTGMHPFIDRPRSPAQVEQAIMDGAITLASRSDFKAEHAVLRGTQPKSLRRTLAGDLEAVLAKAVQADPSARYESAAAFDADLEAWIEGRPVKARRPTMLQHAVKLVRRHPWASSLGAAAVVALTTTTVVAVVQATEAHRQARQASLEAARAKSAKEFLVGLFDGANPDLNGGRDVAARELLMRGEQRIDRDLAGQPQMKAEVLESIAQVWWMFGDMENAARVFERRSAAAGAGGSAEEQVDALMDEVELAAEAGDTEKAAARMAAAREVVKKMRAAPPQLLARMEVEQAWLIVKGRVPDYALAAMHWEKGQALAHAAKDVALEVQALSAKAHAMRRQRRFADAVGAIDQAGELVRRSLALAPSAMMERRLHILRLEKTRNLWSQAEYRQGWPLIDELMRDVETWVGVNSNHFGLLNYRVLWFGYLVQLGMHESAARWVDANPEKYRDLPMTDPLQSVERYRWLAKLWIARSDWPRAADMLERGLAVPGLAGSEANVNLLAVKAEALLRQLEVGPAVHVLNEAELMVQARHGTRWNATLELKQLRAVAESQAGRWTESLNLARAAVADAKQAFGDAHARTARARLGLVVLGLRSPQRDSLSEEMRRELELAQPVLRRSYMPNGELVRIADGLGIVLGGPGAPTVDVPAIAASVIKDPKAFVL